MTECDRLDDHRLQWTILNIMLLHAVIPHAVSWVRLLSERMLREHSGLSLLGSEEAYFHRTCALFTGEAAANDVALACCPLAYNQKIGIWLVDARVSASGKTDKSQLVALLVCQPLFNLDMRNFEKTQRENELQYCGGLSNYRTSINVNCLVEGWGGEWGRA